MPTPMCAAWIMATSFAPSPIASIRMELPECLPAGTQIHFRLLRHAGIIAALKAIKAELHKLLNLTHNRAMKGIVVTVGGSITCESCIELGGHPSPDPEESPMVLPSLH